MQNWLRLHFYPNEFLKLVYRYYAAHGVAWICTYWNVDLELSIYEDIHLKNGYYEILGDLSGMVWKKIMLLPIYNTEAIQPVVFNGDEKGMTKSGQRSNFNIPTEYGIIPTTFDHVHFEADPLRKYPEDNTQPIYQVANFEKSTNTDITFWKVDLISTFSSKQAIEDQTISTFTFCDWCKKIYGIDDSIYLYEILRQNDISVMNKYYNKNAGLYFEKRESN